MQCELTTGCESEAVYEGMTGDGKYKCCEKCSYSFLFWGVWPLSTENAVAITSEKERYVAMEVKTGIGSFYFIRDKRRKCNLNDYYSNTEYRTREEDAAMYRAELLNIQASYLKRGKLDGGSAARLRRKISELDS